MLRLSTLLQLLVVYFLLPIGAAWAGVTTGTIKGSTVDDTDLPVPGVLVTLSSENLMGVRQNETDAEGKFFFPELPPGVYAVKAEKAGFTTVTQTGIQVKIGGTNQLTIQLPLQQAGETITVEAERQAVDTESASHSTVLTKEFLNTLPLGRDYQSAVTLAAGVSGGGGNPNIGGASTNENTYLLDGVNITDPVTGTFSLNFNFDAIEQIEVLVSAYDPEYGINLGGAVNIKTEDGGNTLSFKVSSYYTNANWAPKLDGRWAADGTELAPNDFDSSFEYLDQAAYIEGPLLRDKVWAVLSYQHARSLLRNTGIELPRDYDAHYLFTKITAQPTAAHRFRWLLQTDPTTVDNVEQTNRFTAPEAQDRQAQGGFTTSGQWDWFISPEMFLETKNTIQKSYIERYTVPCTHNQDLGYNPCDPTELENSIDLITPARFGSNQAYSTGSAGYYDFDDRWRFGTDTKLSVLQVEALGTHDIKAGVQADVQYWDKTFGFNGSMYWVDVNLLSYDPNSKQNFYTVESTGLWDFTSIGRHTGLFLQDVWKPVDNLTFRYGTRYDMVAISDDVGTKVLDYGLWGPRLSAIWDPWGDSKTKFTGSVGRFNDTGNFGIASDLFQSNIGYKFYWGEIIESFDNSTAVAAGNVSQDNTTTVLDGLVAPHSDEFTVGAERETWRQIVVGTAFVGKYTRNIYSFDETNQVWDENGYSPLGYADGNGDTYFRLRTPNIARRDYYRTDLYLRRDFDDRFGFFANYSYTSSRGSVQEAPSYWLQIPAQEEYRSGGYLYTDIKHDASIYGSWDLPFDPWTTKLGAIIQGESGMPISRFYQNGWFDGGATLKDTYGTYARMEGYWRASLQVQQAIPVRKGDLYGIVQVENLFNNRQGDAYLSYDNRWIIYDRQTPASATVGARYEF